MQPSHLPHHHGAPVVPDEGGLVVAVVVEQAAQVGGQVVRAVVGDLGGVRSSRRSRAGRARWRGSRRRPARRAGGATSTRARGSRGTGRREGRQPVRRWPRAARSRSSATLLGGPSTGLGHGGMHRRPALAALLRLLLVVLLNGGHDGVARRADELGPVLGRPVPARRSACADESWNCGRHVAGDELVGVAGGRGVGPLVAHEEEGAEAPGLGLQALDLGDGVLDRADDGEARGVQRVDQRLEVGSVSGASGRAATRWK